MALDSVDLSLWSKLAAGLVTAMVMVPVMVKVMETTMHQLTFAVQLAWAWVWSLHAGVGYVDRYRVCLC
jgi:hypothetical protein